MQNLLRFLRKTGSLFIVALCALLSTSSCSASKRLGVHTAPIYKQHCYLRKYHRAYLQGANTNVQSRTIATKQESGIWQMFTTHNHHHQYQAKQHKNHAMYAMIGIAGLVSAILWQEKAEAKGYRGKHGYRPYGCTWGVDYELQAEKALESAQKFKRIVDNHNLPEEDKRAMGVAVIMDLIWAQEQGDHILSKHYYKYGCWFWRSLACSSYDENLRRKDEYDFDLRWEADHIRDLIGVPHPPGWEKKVLPFLMGAAKTMGIFKLVGVASGALGPLGSAIGITAATGIIGYKIGRNIFDREAVFEEEEEKILKALYVKAACADEYYLKEAQEWGGFMVTCAVLLDGIASNLEKWIQKIELAETLEALEAAELLEALELLEAAKVAAKEAAKGLLRIAEKLEKLEGLEAIEGVELIRQSAYNIAKYGGKHYGYYKEFAKKPIGQVIRGIISHIKQVQKHLNLMKDPYKYLKLYGKLKPGETVNEQILRKKWAIEIKRFLEEIYVLIGVLTEKMTL